MVQRVPDAAVEELGHDQKEDELRMIPASRLAFRRCGRTTYRMYAATTTATRTITLKNP